MTISEVKGSGFLPDPLKNKKEKDLESSKRPLKDTAEVSDKARELFEAEQTKRFRDIEEKIASGFYFKREVTEKVADAILEKLHVVSSSS